MQEIINALTDKALAILNGGGGAIAQFAHEVATYGVVSNSIEGGISIVTFAALVFALTRAWRWVVNAEPDEAERAALILIPGSIVGAIVAFLCFLNTWDCVNAASKAYFAPNLYVIQQVQALHK